ncbi:MAG: hypothetical protein AAFV25_11220, partial [Bacteroidota bacterium]
MRSNNCMTSTLVLMILIFPFFLSASTPLTINSTDNDDNICSKKEKYCEGKRTFKDGSSYEGEFKYGEPHGWGILTWPDGDVYEGEFEDGFRHGKGEQRFVNGDVYAGNFVYGY